MPDQTEVARSFGYSLAFFQSNPELQSLLDRATSQNYTPDRFVAELQNTTWFRVNGESARKMAALKSSDPATYAQYLSKVQSQISSQAGQMGVQMSTSDLAELTGLALQFSWDQNQIQQALGSKVISGSASLAGGNAAALETQYRQILDDYGITVSDDTVGSWVRDGVLGRLTADSVRAYAAMNASSRYAGLADRIKAGETVKQIADPYIQAHAKLLEVNPATLSISDASIQKALQATDSQGKPAPMTLWQYEQALRQDPRWMRTKNAQDELMGSARSILQTWGLSI